MTDVNFRQMFGQDNKFITKYGGQFQK